VLLLVQERIEVWGESATRTVVGLSEQLRPVLGETDVVRLTVPTNLLMGVIVIVEFPVRPARSWIEVGLAVIAKSGTFTL